MTTIKNVTIGERFMKDGREYTVADFYTTTNLNGELVKQECIVEYLFCGQLMRTNIAFATVVMSRIKSNKSN